MNYKEIEKYRNELILQRQHHRDRSPLDFEEESIFNARVHLAMHYICRGQKLPETSHCNCPKGWRALGREVEKVEPLDNLIFTWYGNNITFDGLRPRVTRWVK